MTLSEEASKPFNRTEVKIILESADRMTHYDRHGRGDPSFYGRLVRVFLTFGVHPSKIPELGPAFIQRRPTERGDRYYLVFLRPKAQARRRHIDFEVPTSMITWLPTFLAQEKPISEWAYWKAMLDVQKEVAKSGYFVKVNPLRFRHTAIREQLARGVPQIDVQASFGTTAETLERYGLSTAEQRGEQMEKIEWGSWGES